MSSTCAEAWRKTSQSTRVSILICRDSFSARLALALFVPFLQLASLASFILLLIFFAVNASLYIIGARAGAPEKLRRWRWWGVFGAFVSLALAAMEALG